jgi:hypothetical protein
MPEEFLKYIPLAALCISLLALFVSCVNIGWGIYKEVSLRGRVRVKFGYRQIHHATFPKPLDRVLISAVNYGPGSVKLGMVIYRKASLWGKLCRKTERGVIIHDYTDPMSGRLPSKLDVGESIDIMLGTPEKLTVSEDITHIGVNDTFGRSHWAPRRDVREYVTLLREKKKSG